MNREAIGVLILFGVAAFLFSRQSQAAYSPGAAPAATSWNPLQYVEDALTELTTPIETPPDYTPSPAPEEPAPMPTAEPEHPPFSNPIPPLPAI